MRTIIVCLAMLALSIAGSMARAQTLQDKEAAFKALEGAEFDPADAPPVALEAWPDGPADVLAIATLEDAGSHASPGALGTLRVGLVTRQGAALVLAASDESSGHPEPERTVTPSVPDVSIDRAVFRISPGEAALGVDVSESLNTSSTSAGASSLFLYRRTGTKLVPIFSAPTDDFVLDKTEPHPRMAQTRHIVRFTSHLTHGFYDLILARPRARAGRTYVWDGARYSEVRRRRSGS